MSYVEKTIGKNETIIYRVEFHWTYSLIAFLYLLVLGIVLIGIFIFLKMMINKWTTERVLTDERYIQKIVPPQYIDSVNNLIRKEFWI